MKTRNERVREFLADETATHLLMVETHDPGADCPRCGKPSGLVTDVQHLGDEAPCINCGAALTVEHDYCGDDYDLSIWLEEVKP